MGEKPKPPRCPICGAPMQRTNRGVPRQSGHRWICPIAEAEVFEDELGHRHRIS